jgi:ABC-type glycerol-3-phosphate transport system substrate-binding protein
VLYKYNLQEAERTMKFTFSADIKISLLIGILLTLIISISLFNFSNNTFANKTQAVQGEEVVENVYKFDFPFLGDKVTLENTLKSFEENHPDLKVNYIYTGPDELNSKKKTHMLLYVFTEERK